MVSFVFDIETDGLLDTVTKIHCISMLDVDSGIIRTYVDIPLAVKILSKVDLLVGHNIINFDLPCIKKLYPEFAYKAELMDTLILSKMLFPKLMIEDVSNHLVPKNMTGRHSLEAWGHRLDFAKGEYAKQDNAWMEWTPEMSVYCENDVELTKKLYDQCVLNTTSMEALKTEMKFAGIIQKQISHGVCFNENKANKLLNTLNIKHAELQKSLEQKLPAQIKGKKTVPFNPGSGKQLTDYFMKTYSWQPEVFTPPSKTYPSGQPQMNAEVLATLDYPEVPEILDFLTVKKRIGSLSTGAGSLLHFVQEGKLFGKVDTVGAVSYRCTHSSPNLSQITSVRKPYGKEFRELFEPDKGYVMVGFDASGLELRCLAHYMNDVDYIETVCNGDIHTLNQISAGLPTRDIAKRFIYAYLYGGGDELIGNICGGNAALGRRIKNQFLASLPKLKKLLDDLNLVTSNRDYLIGIDGRKLYVRNNYSALNLLLQSCGAVVLKVAINLLYDRLTVKGWKHGKEYALLLNIHDEQQAQVYPELADEYGEIAVQCVRDAGKLLKMRCPQDAVYKIGQNWSECH